MTLTYDASTFLLIVFYLMAALVSLFALPWFLEVFDKYSTVPIWSWFVVPPILLFLHVILPVFILPASFSSVDEGNLRDEAKATYGYTLDEAVEVPPEHDDESLPTYAFDNEDGERTFCAVHPTSDPQGGSSLVLSVGDTRERSAELICDFTPEATK